jgi:hypothetical protein
LFKTSTGQVARAVASVLAAAVLAALSGCGTESYPNNPRPPAVKTVSVLISEKEIVISPKDFGAGPTRFIVANQTGAKQGFVVSSDRSERTVPIDKFQTANFKVDTEPGVLVLDADNAAVDALEINVGPMRPSAQQDLDQP